MGAGDSGLCWDAYLEAVGLLPAVPLGATVAPALVDLGLTICQLSIVVGTWLNSALLNSSRTNLLGTTKAFRPDYMALVLDWFKKNKTTKKKMK